MKAEANMAQEIERKFLVRGDAWHTDNGTLIRQGYLYSGINGVVRVRTTGEHAYLTVKGRKFGISRLEFEYEIPLAEANEMLDKLCFKPLIEKVRHEVPMDGFTWEIDEFLGENAGLVVAEIELEDENQEFLKPDWVGIEVSNDVRYLNSNLVKNPYAKWGRK